LLGKGRVYIYPVWAIKKIKETFLSLNQKILKNTRPKAFDFENFQKPETENSLIPKTSKNQTVLTKSRTSQQWSILKTPDIN
jgi:hypothetical protein